VHQGVGLPGHGGRADDLGHLHEAAAQGRSVGCVDSGQHLTIGISAAGCYRESHSVPRSAGRGGSADDVRRPSVLWGAIEYLPGGHAARRSP
jgi:hypothetical protein